MPEVAPMGYEVANNMESSSDYAVGIGLAIMSENWAWDLL